MVQQKIEHEPSLLNGTNETTNLLKRKTNSRGFIGIF